MLDASRRVASDGVQRFCDNRNERCSGGVLTADVVDKPDTAMGTSPLQ